MGGKLAVRNFAAFGTTLLRVVFVLILLILLIPGGSARMAPLYMFSALMFLLTGIASVTARDKKTVRHLLVPPLAVAIVLVAWVSIQAFSFEANPLANSIWAKTALLTGQQAGAISIAPGDTVAALIPLMLPFSTFICGILLLDSDERVLTFLRALTVIATVGSLIAVVQLELFPDWLLFFEKTAYLDSATVFFVNRNTTGTYLAIHLIVALGLAFHHGQKIHVGDYDEILRKGQRAQSWSDFIHLTLNALAAIVIFCTLLLTRSRGGLAFGMVGLMLFVMILAYWGPAPNTAGRRASSGRVTPRRWLRVSIVFVVCAVVAVLFGGRALLRASELGAEDGRYCAYPHILRLLGDNWLTGTGLGTFMDAFTPYRSAACGIMPIWDKAHSVYLEAWITLGIIALIVILAVIGWLSWVLTQGMLSRSNYRWAPAAGLGILVTVILHSAVDFSLQIPGFAASFAAIMAGMVRIASGRSKGRRSEPVSRN